MKQRLAIAQAVMEQPKLIILDEPTNALDKKGVQLVWNLIREERERGATILIASHNQEDLQQMCSDFFEMYEGRLEKRGDAAMKRTWYLIHGCTRLRRVRLSGHRAVFLHRHGGGRALHL